MELEKNKGYFVSQVILNFRLQPRETWWFKCSVVPYDDQVKNALPHWKGHSLTGM